MNPPDHPTPRTNAIAHRGYPEPAYIVEMTDLARTLERELIETERLRFGADADRRRLRALSDQLSDNLSAVGAAYNAEKARAEKAEAEVERLTAKIANQADRIRYLEGATNHATGTPLSQAIALTEKAEDIIRSLRRISNIPIGSDAATNPAMKGTP
jgi:hypothetical protein